jgi:hypothetical protein
LEAVRERGEIPTLAQVSTEEGQPSGAANAPGRRARVAAFAYCPACAVRATGASFAEKTYYSDELFVVSNKTIIFGQSAVSLLQVIRARYTVDSPTLQRFLGAFLMASSCLFATIALAAGNYYRHAIGIPAGQRL